METIVTDSFPQLAIEELGHYVYFLRDPRDKKIFYIGKGSGNRIFDHIRCALNDTPSEKLDLIREIQNAGKSVEHFVLRHGLKTENHAFEIEAAAIDLIGFQNLANLQRGHGSTDFGIKSTAEIIAMYSAQQLETNLPVMLFNINKRFSREMTSNEIYQATRYKWRVGKKRNNGKYAIAVYRGITREVYVIQDWVQDGDDLWSFNGYLAEEDVRHELQHKSVSNLFLRGAQNPVRYVNC